jgi:hypothetical protein
MKKIDLSAFRQNYVKDTAEDMKEIAALKSTTRIPEGAHEVVVTAIHEKDGVKYKLTDKLGGTVGFSLVVKDSLKREQMLYISIPLVVSFKQACMDSDNKVKFQFRQSIKNLQLMGLDPMLLREAMLMSDCEALDYLVGTQFVIINSWDNRKLHLEYDATAKAHYFVTSSGDRFNSGEIAAPIALDAEKKDDTRYAEAIAIAHAQGYQLATRMDVNVDTHPTASNEAINEALQKVIQPKKVAPTVINKTIPAFPVTPKKILAPLSVEPDLYQGE